MTPLVAAVAVLVSLPVGAPAMIRRQTTRSSDSNPGIHSCPPS